MNRKAVTTLARQALVRPVARPLFSHPLSTLVAPLSSIKESSGLCNGSRCTSFIRKVAQPYSLSKARFFSALPSHTVIGMPSLSPTMEAGTIGELVITPVVTPLDPSFFKVCL